MVATDEKPRFKIVISGVEVQAGETNMEFGDLVDAAGSIIKRKIAERKDGAEAEGGDSE